MTGRHGEAASGKLFFQTQAARRQTLPGIGLPQGNKQTTSILG